MYGNVSEGGRHETAFKIHFSSAAVIPQRLIMTAFGIFKEKTVVDFPKPGQNGVFFLSGDSGSGKSTVCTALRYALFGDEGLRMPECGGQASVELLFRHEGKRYYIRRAARPYHTDGYSFAAGNASSVVLLCFDTGTEHSGRRKVDHAVAELFGVDALTAGTLLSADETEGEDVFLTDILLDRQPVTEELTAICKKLDTLDSAFAARETALSDSATEMHLSAMRHLDETEEAKKRLDADEKARWLCRQRAQIQRSEKALAFDRHIAEAVSLSASAAQKAADEEKARYADAILQLKTAPHYEAEALRATSLLRRRELYDVLEYRRDRRKIRLEWEEKQYQRCLDAQKALRDRPCCTSAVHRRAGLAVKFFSFRLSYARSTYYADEDDVHAVRFAIERLSPYPDMSSEELERLRYQLCGSAAKAREAPVLWRQTYDARQRYAKERREELLTREEAVASAERRLSEQQKAYREAFAESGFTDDGSLENARLPGAVRKRLENKVRSYEQCLNELYELILANCSRVTKARLSLDKEDGARLQGMLDDMRTIAEIRLMIQKLSVRLDEQRYDRSWCEWKLFRKMLPYINARYGVLTNGENELAMPDRTQERIRPLVRMANTDTTRSAERFAGSERFLLRLAVRLGIGDTGKDTFAETLLLDGQLDGLDAVTRDRVLSCLRSAANHRLICVTTTRPLGNEQGIRLEKTRNGTVVSAPNAAAFCPEGLPRS